MSIDFHGFYAVLAPTRTHKKTVFGTVTSAPTQKRFGIVFGNHHSCPQDAMHKTNILGGWRNQLGQYFFDMLYRAVDRSQLGPCRHHIFVHIDNKASRRSKTVHKHTSHSVWLSGCSRSRNRSSRSCNRSRRRGSWFVVRCSLFLFAT